MNIFHPVNLLCTSGPNVKSHVSVKNKNSVRVTISLYVTSGQYMKRTYPFWKQKYQCNERSFKFHKFVLKHY